VLVTGGGGFIGSNLARRLLEQGDDVRVLDNFSTGQPPQPRDIADEIEIVEASCGATSACTTRRAASRSSSTRERCRRCRAPCRTR
jgi:nucleoside-diphosphate-sugar epimerase